MEHTSALHFLISGKVQNVFYRRFCQTQAQRLNLSGWARNLDDGRVEIKVYGDITALEIFEKKLWQGPMLANVTDILAEKILFESYEGFDVF